MLRVLWLVKMAIAIPELAKNSEQRKATSRKFEFTSILNYTVVILK